MKPEDYLTPAKRKKIQSEMIAEFVKVTMDLKDQELVEKWHKGAEEHGELDLNQNWCAHFREEVVDCFWYTVLRHLKMSHPVKNDS